MNKDRRAYQLYMQFCTRLGIRPAPYDIWFETTKKVSDTAHDLTTFSDGRRPESRTKSLWFGSYPQDDERATA